MVFTSKFVGTGPSSYEKRIYRAAVSQRLRNTALRCNIRYKVQVMKVFVTQPSSASCYFLIFGPNTSTNLLPNTFTP